nr:ribonuclease H-like domain-containing protein [Tanacetum cinerariifolium]
SESLDQIHDGLKKLVSQLEIHGVSLSQEDVNLNLKIYESEVKKSFSRGTAPQNLAFMSSTPTDSTTNSVSAAASVSAACVKFPTSSLPNVDSLSNAVIYSFFASQSTSPRFDNEDLKQIDVDDLEKMDLSECRSLKDLSRPGAAEPQRGTVPVETSISNALVSKCDGTRSYDWSYQADEEPANISLMAFTSNSSFDNEPPSNLYDRFQPSGGYHAVPTLYTGAFMPPKPNLVFNTASTAVKTDHLAFNIQLSPTKPKQDLSHTTRPSAPIINDWPIETTISVATYVPASPKSHSSGKRRNRKACFICKSVDHLIKDCDYHTKKMAQPTPRNYAHRGHHKQYALLTHSKPQIHTIPTAMLTQSKPVSNTAVRPVSVALPNLTVTRPRNAHQGITKFKSPIRRHITRSLSLRTGNSPPRVNAVQAPMVSVVQGKQGTWGNTQQALKDKGVIDSGCSRHMTGNMSYLSDFKELNRGYVSFGGNPKGGKITGKGKIKTGKLDFDDVYFVKELKFNLFSVSQMCDKKNSVLFIDTECLVLSSDFKLPDESQMLLRVPRENNMYNVNLKNIVPSGDLTCLFDKTTLNESNLWHRRLAHVNFKTINKLVKGNLVRGLPTKVFENDHTCVACRRGEQHRASCKFQGKVDEGFLVGYSVCSKAFRVFNSRTRIIQETLHVNFMENKPNVAGTGPTWLFDIDSLTRTMNYQPVHAGNQTNSGAGFQDNFDAEKAREEVDQSYMLFSVWSAGSINPHNNAEDAAFDGKEHDFDVKKPESKVILFPSSSAQSKEQDDKIKKEAKGKSFVESVTGYRDLKAEFEDYSENSRLEDIIYSDDEDVVGAEVDFKNLESLIPVSPIPTTRIHKDHPVSQIISDLSSTTQTRSMTRAVKDQGFEDHDHPDKVYKVVKALYGLHQAPRAWYETLATYHLENGFQRGTIDQTLFIKKQKGDILLVQIYVDDIIFGATNKDLCRSFEKLMKDKFQMSSMGELTFFLGLQPTQTVTMLGQAWIENLELEDVISLDADCNTPKNACRSGILSGGITS